MATRQYIGARYVPKFADPIDWSNSKSYEPLTIVKYLSAYYTSKKFVPAGTAPTNTNYWAETGNYNEQVELYRQETFKKIGSIESDDTTVYYVGEDEEYTNISDVLEYLSHNKPLNGVTVDIVLKSGFTMKEQVVVDAQDFSWVTIKSEGGAEVEVNKSYITQDTVDIPAIEDYASVVLKGLFTGLNGACLPIIDCDFSVSGTNSIVGIAVYNNSTAYVTPTHGFDGFNINLYVIHNSKACVAGAHFNDAVNNSVNVFRSSDICAGGCEITGNGGWGAYVDSNSTGEFSSCSINSNANGLRVETNCLVACTGGDISNNTNSGVVVANGGKFGGRENTINGNKTNATVQSGGMFTNINGEMKNATDIGVRVQTGIAFISGSNITGATNKGVYSSDSIVEMKGANAQRTPGVNGNADICFDDGSLLLMHNSTGGCNNMTGVLEKTGTTIGRPATYELLNEITVDSQTTSLTLTQDDAGHNYSIGACLIVVESNSGASGDTEWVAKNVNETIGAMKLTGTCDNSGKRYYTVEFRSEYGFWKSLGGKPTSTPYLVHDVCSTQNSIVTKAKDSYKYFNKLVANGTITAGSIIKIYGVRA